MIEYLENTGEGQNLSRKIKCLIKGVGNYLIFRMIGKLITKFVILVIR